MFKKTALISWSLYVLLFIFLAFGWFFFYTTLKPAIVLIGIMFLALFLGYIWSQKIEIGFYVFCASLFFTRFPTIEVFNFTLSLGFIFALGLFFAFLIRFFKRKVSFSFRPKILFWSLFLFWVSNLISFLINPISFRSFAVFLLISFCILFFIFVSSFNFKEVVLKNLVSILIWGSFLVCLFAFYQYFGDLFGISYKFTLLREHYTKEIFGFPRVQATFLEPLLFANFLLIPISILGVLWLKDKIKNSVFAFIAPFYLIPFILTMSRGAYLALAIGCLFILIFSWRNFSFKKILGIILVLVLSVVVSKTLIEIAGKGAWQNFYSHTSEIVKKPSEQGFSTEHRLSTYELGFQAFKEKPFFGLGPSNFGPYYDAHIKEEVLKNPYQTVSNEYIEILAENGILGFIGFAGFIISLAVFGIKSFLKKKDALEKNLLLAFLASFISIFFQYNFFSTIYILYIWFILAMVLNLERNYASKNN